MTTQQSLGPDLPHPLPFRGKTPTVRERPDGRWEIRVTVKRNEKPRSWIAPTRAAVIERWNKWLYAPTEPLPASPATSLPSALVPKRPKSVNELVDLWLERQKTKADRTFETSRDQWNNHLRKIFGELRMEQLTKPIVTAYLHGLEESNMMTTSLARRKSALSGPFSYALQFDWLDKNPTRGVKIPAPEAGLRALATREEEPEPMWIPDLDQINAFLKANLGDELYGIWFTGFTVGARPGELIAMATDCLKIGPDGVVDQVSIHRQGYRRRVAGRPWRFTKPKWKSSRVLDAPAETINILIDQVAISRALNDEHPEWPAEWRNLLWRNEKGMPIDPSDLTTLFHTRCRRAGWDEVEAYTMRHACLSAMLDSDDPIVPLARVAAFAGHKDGGATLAKTYAHILKRKESRRAEGRVFEGRIGPDCGQVRGQLPGEAV